MDSPIAQLNHMRFRKSLKTDSGDWYQVVQELGRGGNAVTFLVMQTSGARPGLLYAMKVFYEITEEARGIQFAQEIEFLKSCSHPCVMEVTDTGTFRARVGEKEFLYYPYVVAEYLPTTLNDVIREGRTTFVEKVAYIIQLLSALDYIGSLNPAVIHRDIKPQNIFLKGKSCVLGDFGLMKRFEADYEGDQSMFKATSLPGMPYYYRSPDLVAYAKGGYRLTPASDVFQLGLVAAHLFTGRNPCIRPRNILDNVELEPLGSIPGKQSAGVAKLIERMLALDPTQRPTPRYLIDPWQGVFWEASQRSIDLEGRAL